MNSPLEQFEIFFLIPFYIGSFDLSFTNSSFFIIFVFFIFIFLFRISFIGNMIPNNYQIIFETFYKFIYDIAYENIGKKGSFLFPFIFSLFFFLLLSNLIGLVPFSFTITSHFIITFILSFIVWFGKLVLGFKIHGLKLFGLLLPSGIPFVIVPFFVIVETISFIIPLVALGVRLFANIMSGHILLKVIVGFCWTIIISGGVIFVFHFIPMLVLYLLLFLETAVAFIQAYVFTILTCLITGDVIKGGHLFIYYL